ncbi:MAG: helicase-related protein, partial [Planctomycetota bacterium]
GMLPTMKEVVEQLFTSGLIKLLFATETFAVGVNMPAKSVVFDEITKFHRIRRTFIRSRDYHQMAGRAGRRNIDPVGYAYLRLPPYGARASVIERITDEANIEEIKSQFNLSYSCILSLYHTLKENIYQAAQKSLSNYQAGRGRQKKESHFSQSRYNNIIDQLRKKINLLNRLGYIRDKALTDKGLIAKQVYSFELSLTEFITQGVFNQLSPDQINILLVALVYESKRRDWGKKLDPQITRSIQRPALPIVIRLLDEERKVGITPSVRLLDFKLASATYAWSCGALFKDMIDHTSALDGDIIRTFRLSIQLVRQMLRLGRHNNWPQPLMNKFNICFSKMSRDEVDAEKQLRQSAE